MFAGINAQVRTNTDAARKHRLEEERLNKLRKKGYGREAQTHDRAFRDIFWLGVKGTIDVQKRHKEAIHVPKSKNRAVVKTNGVDHKTFLQSHLFHPRSASKMIWDLTLGMLALYSVVVTPLLLAFDDDSRHQSIEAVNFIIDFFFIADVWVSFNTAVIDAMDLFIIDRGRIAAEYIRGRFWSDLICALPFDIISDIAIRDTTSISFLSLKLFRTVKLMRATRIVRYVKLPRAMKHFDLLRINPALMHVVLLCFQVLLIAHYIACFWFYITTNTVNWDKDWPTWARDNDMSSESFFGQYVASLYWTLVTMLSIGYGDFHAINTLERVYAAITMITGVVMFGVVIAQVVRLIEAQNPQARAFKMRMAEMRGYLSSKKRLPSELKHRAKIAYAYCLKNKLGMEDDHPFIQELPRGMKLSLLTTIYDHALKKVRFFTKSNVAFACQILSQCKPFQVKRGDVICEVGDVADEIFFVISGLVRIMSLVGRKKVIAGYVRDGGFFGDFEFVIKSVRTVTCIAASNCNLLSISTLALASIMEDNLDAGNALNAEISARLKNFQSVIETETQPADSRMMSGPQTGGASARISRRLMSRRKSSAIKTIAATVKATSTLSFSVRGVVSYRRNTGSNIMMDLFSSGGRTKRRPSMKSFDNDLTFFKLMWVDGVNRLPCFLEEEFTDLDEFEYDDAMHRILRYEKGQKVVVEEYVFEIGRFYLIHPLGFLKYSWDMVIGIFTIITVMIIPVQVGFEIASTGSYGAFDDFVDIMLFIDMLLSFRTLYYSHAEDAFIAVPERIFYHYVISGLAVDFFSCVPLDDFFFLVVGRDGTGYDNLSFLRAFKLARFVKVFKYIRMVENDFGLSPLYYDMLKMLVFVVLTIHMIACLWWLLCFKGEPHEGWANVGFSVLPEASTHDKYVASLYFTITTLTTTGYGDIFPRTTYERSIWILIMLIAVNLVGYGLANLSTMIGSLNQSSMQQRERISEVIEFLAEKQCPHNLGDSIIRHFQKQFKQKSAFDEENILSKLPRRISDEIILLESEETMNKISIFHYVENKSVALHIFRSMIPVTFSADQCILKEGDVASEIAFIVLGSAKAYRSPQEQRADQYVEKMEGGRRDTVRGNVDTGIDEDEDERDNGVSKRFSAMTDEELERLGRKTVGVLGEGDFVGHIALMKHARYAASVRALGHCKVYILRETEIIRLAHEFPSVAMTLQTALGLASFAQSRRRMRDRVKDNRAKFLGGIKKSFLNDDKSPKSLKKVKRKSLSQIFPTFEDIAPAPPNDVDTVPAVPKKQFTKFNLDSILNEKTIDYYSDDDGTEVKKEQEPEKPESIVKKLGRRLSVKSFNIRQRNYDSPSGGTMAIEDINAAAAAAAATLGGGGGASRGGRVGSVALATSKKSTVAHDVDATATAAATVPPTTAEVNVAIKRGRSASVLGPSGKKRRRSILEVKKVKVGTNRRRNSEDFGNIHSLDRLEDFLYSCDASPVSKKAEAVFSSRHFVHPLRNVRRRTTPGSFVYKKI